MGKGISQMSTLLIDKLVFLLDQRGVAPADFEPRLTEIESVIPHIKRSDWISLSIKDLEYDEYKDAVDHILTNVPHSPPPPVSYPPQQNVKWVLDSISGQGIMGIGYGLDSDNFVECYTIQQVIKEANRDNMYYQFGIVYGNVAFLNQVESGVSMLVIRQDVGILRAWSLGAFTYGDIAHALAAPVDFNWKGYTGYERKRANQYVISNPKIVHSQEHGTHRRYDLLVNGKTILENKLWFEVADLVERTIAPQDTYIQWEYTSTHSGQTFLESCAWIPKEDWVNRETQTIDEIVSV